MSILKDLIHCFNNNRESKFYKTHQEFNFNLKSQKTLGVL